MTITKVHVSHSPRKTHFSIDVQNLLRSVHLIWSLFEIGHLPLLEWYMARLALENGHQKRIFSDEHWDSIECSKYIKHYSRFNSECNWEDLHDHSKNKTLKSYNFCISTLIWKVKWQSLWFCNCQSKESTPKPHRTAKNVFEVGIAHNMSTYLTYQTCWWREGIIAYERSIPFIHPT